jgi:rifampicin phosphotransferase
MAGRIETSPPTENRPGISLESRADSEHLETHVPLSASRATQDSLTGAKAAALARAKALGLPVLPGFAITTSASARILIDPEALNGPIGESLRAPWKALARGGEVSVVVRSSSTAEDGSSSSMAGMFTSVTDVKGWDAFLDAVVEVVTSSRRVDSATPAPIAVLVQPFLDAKVGGVMFGIDPVSGRTDRLVVAVADGPPERLVSGEVQGARYVLRPNGRVVEAESGDSEATLGPRRRRALAHLAQRAQSSFGGPQDVEWAIDVDGRLWLLQSRPVTAVGTTAAPIGPVLGPGPVAETFPKQLSLLEEDLWVESMRAGIRHALTIVGTSPRRRILSSVVVTSIEGRVAADLDLFGALPSKKSFLQRLDPRPAARRLRAGWDVGRLKSALPAVIERLVTTVDDELTKLPPLWEITDEGLNELLRRSRQTLVALHGHEVLAGMLMSPDASAPTAASIAMRAIAEARTAGVEDADIIQRSPVVLALVPPTVGRRIELPPVPALLPAAEAVSDPLAHARERARLRVRWVQELTARACEEAGGRLLRAGLIDAATLHLLTSEELMQALSARRAPDAVMDRVPRQDAPPLPATFRLTADGAIVREANHGNSEGRGAGGGRGKGTVCLDPGSVAAGDVLVVRTLDPDLATVLPGLGGLVSETGSVLSHLAILAREFGVPTVVNVAGALERYAVGTPVVVDGSTGEVTALPQDEL